MSNDKNFDLIVIGGGTGGNGVARTAANAGWKVASIDNRRLAKVAKLAGAPSNAEAGVFCRLKVGDRVDIGDRLFEICANTLGALDYALEFAAAHDGIVEVRDEE